MNPEHSVKAFLWLSAAFPLSWSQYILHVTDNYICKIIKREEKNSLLVSVSADVLINFTSYVVSLLCLSRFYEKAHWSENQANESFNMN